MTSQCTSSIGSALTVASSLVNYSTTSCPPTPTPPPQGWPSPLSQQLPTQPIHHHPQPVITSQQHGHHTAATAARSPTPTKSKQSLGSPPPLSQPHSQFQLDSDSSDDEDEQSPDDDQSTGSTGHGRTGKLPSALGHSLRGPLSSSGTSPPDTCLPPRSPVDSLRSLQDHDYNQSTMWLGTEDGW